MTAPRLTPPRFTYCEQRNVLDHLRKCKAPGATLTRLLGTFTGMRPSTLQHILQHLTDLGQIGQHEGRYIFIPEE